MFIGLNSFDKSRLKSLDNFLMLDLTKFFFDLPLHFPVFLLELLLKVSFLVDLLFELFLS